MERMGLRGSIEAPHETQRPLAGGGEFFTPQEGQVIDEGVFAAAAIGDRLGKRTPWGKGVAEERLRPPEVAEKTRPIETAGAPVCRSGILRPPVSPNPSSTLGAPSPAVRAEPD